ncbi:hypothetical protein Ahy_A02g009761 isoform A [Arachis hypogaea]|uniref:Uncharacterized protein n=1 Tax=Arachis hypogaea TaxID=3818 RepID=A0A445EHX4_ARAHY|nr:hypothetical protein Ahy_A02g009761 isoform A [Arachis hypogaea]
MEKVYLYSYPASNHIHWISCRHGNYSSTCSSSKSLRTLRYLPSTQPSRRPLSSGDWTLLKLQAYSFNFSRPSIELSIITPFHKACSSAATTQRVAAVYWIGTPTVSQL